MCRYNFYKPLKPQDAFVTNYDLTTFAISNASLGCLGEVYSNYMVICLNNRNLANTLELGESVGNAPFNDKCFQLATACGTTCVDSSSGGGQYPISCDAGAIPQSLLVTNKTETRHTGSDNIEWGGDLHFIEWFILLVIFVDTVGNILKALPLVSGRPTELESSRLCRLDGQAVLGLASPFVSEDEAVFLRSLLGRTCTMLRTVSGRHTLQSLYVDTILNEKRGSGEKSRYHLWVAWLQFLDRMAMISSEPSSAMTGPQQDTAAAVDGIPPTHMHARDVHVHESTILDDHTEASRHSFMSRGSGADGKAANSTAYLRNLSAAHILASARQAKIVMESGADPVDARDSLFGWGRLSIDERAVGPPPSRRPSATHRARRDTLTSTGMNIDLYDLI